MITQELINYIRQSLSGGQPKEQIKSILLEQGWAQEDIERGFGEAGFDAKSPVPSQGGQETKVVLVSIGDLFKQSWSFYKKNFLKLIAIAGLPYILLLIFSLFVFNSSFLESFSWERFVVSALRGPVGVIGPLLSFPAVYLIIFIAYVILSIWATIALFYFIKGRGENIGVFESYKKGARQFFSYIWISIILTFVLIGSSYLLIIPGIITAIWVVFAVYVLIWEDKKGFSALLRSRELVRGYWGKVLGRLLALAVFPLFIILISFGLGFFASDNIKNIVNSALGFLIGPFAVYYSYLIYNSLAKIKGPSVAPLKKKWFIATFIVGVAVLLVPIILFFVVFGGS